MEYSIIIILNTDYYFYSAALKLLNEKLDLPPFINVSISRRTQKKMESLAFKKENEDVEINNADENLGTFIEENGTNKTTFGLVFNNKLVLWEKNYINQPFAIHLSIFSM